MLLHRAFLLCQAPDLRPQFWRRALSNCAMSRYHVTLDAAILNKLERARNGPKSHHTRSTCSKSCLPLRAASSLLAASKSLCTRQECFFRIIPLSNSITHHSDATLSPCINSRRVQSCSFRTPPEPDYHHPNKRQYAKLGAFIPSHEGCIMVPPKFTSLLPV